MKRKLFIGSSSGPGSEIAKKVEAHINTVCGDWIECDTWDRGDVFGINRSFLESLLRAAQRYHYGIFVATKDDPTVKKGASVVEPRDNVIFEMGLFLGSMGVSRSFLLVEKGVGLPSDFEGITVPQFSIEGEQGALSAADIIIRRIGRTRKSFNLKPIPSAVLALGYFDNFLKPFATGYWRENKGQNRGQAKLKILLPKGLISLKDKNDLNALIDAYEALNSSEDVSIFQPGTRPVIKKTRDGSIFWDIPTTIFTLKQLFDKIPSDAELIGVDEQQEQWLLSEVYEFGRSIIELKNETIDFQRGISTDVALVEIKDGKALETPLDRL